MKFRSKQDKMSQSGGSGSKVVDMDHTTVRDEMLVFLIKNAKEIKKFVKQHMKQEEG